MALDIESSPTPDRYGEPMAEHENEDRLSELFTGDRFATSNGVRLLEWTGGTATAVATPGPESSNFVGSVHGGFLFTAADVAASVAANSWGRICVAVSIDIEYLSGSAAGDELRFTATEAARGRNLATYRVEGHRGERLLTIASVVTFRTAEWHFGADAWSEEWRGRN